MKKRVLIFPAGAENALEIYDALRYNVNVEVYGASGKKDFAEYIYPEGKYIEGEFYIYTPDFKSRFKKLLDEYKIDIIIPTHDEIALYFAGNRKDFEQQILVSDFETAKVCREKKLMYDLLKTESFCPIVYNEKSVINEQDFPVFIKPNKGAGAVGAKVIKSFEELDLIENIQEFVLTEYLPGEEISIDCFTGFNGKLKFVGSRSRDRIQMGIAFRSTRIETTPEIYEIAEVINSKLSFLGAWYFQLKKDSQGKYKLLEISCRQAGTMTLYRHLGVNFPLLGIFELQGFDTTIVLNKGECQLERRIATKFNYQIEYDTVYVDFDDTIVVDNKVCDPLIRFLYQCVNNKKKIVLLTRHEKNLKETLSRYRISEQLFDDIYQFDFSKGKTDYINPQKAIFIDNSYAERKKVSQAFSIPVFDVDMVDMLLED